MTEALHEHQDEPRARRSNFTIGALVVVIGVILFAAALLLPAIEAAREAARRNQCNNNLKQIIFPSGPASIRVKAGKPLRAISSACHRPLYVMEAAAAMPR